MKWSGILAFLLLLLPTSLLAIDYADVSITAKPPSIIPIVEAGNVTDITSVSAVLHATVYAGGENVACRGFEWGTESGNYSFSWNETGVFAEGHFEHCITELNWGTEYFWRAYAVNEMGRGNSTEQSFVCRGLPGPPQDFKADTLDHSTILLSWIPGAGANATIIRGSQTGYPKSPTDGLLIYSGNGTNVTVSDLDLDITSYYYCAWSSNPAGYSLTCARARAGAPIALPAMIFVVGMCGLALWKRGWIRLLLSLATLTWGVTAMQYDAKVGITFISMAFILFVTALLRLYQLKHEA